MRNVNWVEGEEEEERSFSQLLPFSRLPPNHSPRPDFISIAGRLSGMNLITVGHYVSLVYIISSFPVHELEAPQFPAFVS